MQRFDQCIGRRHVRVAHGVCHGRSPHEPVLGSAKYPNFIGIRAARSLPLDPRTVRGHVRRVPKLFLTGQLGRGVREPNGSGTLARRRDEGRARIELC
jgi:hypothetical protein